MDMDTARPAKGWLLAGLLLLAWCYAGNWLALPGYRRFLAGESGDASGLAFAWGAFRTITWMLAFHLGATALALATLRGRARLTLGLGASGWIALWSIPALPGPWTPFFAGLGLIILLLAAATLSAPGTTGSRDIRKAAYLFFAFATWDICGLGSAGGILRPDSAHFAANHGLVVTQTTKLMVELAIAWTLATLAERRR